MIIIKEGPSFELLPNCNTCCYAKFNVKIGDDETGKIYCNIFQQELGHKKPIRLNMYRNSTLVEPHSACPLIDKNAKEYHSEQIKNINFKEINKVEKVIKELFPKFLDYSLYTDSGTIKFRIFDTDLKNLIELKERTTRNVVIKAYDKLSFDIILTKEKINE